jgi:hypothetical protein
MRAQGEEIKSPPPSAKKLNNLMCDAKPKARQSYYAHNLSVSHQPYATMRRDDRRKSGLEYLGIYTNRRIFVILGGRFKLRRRHNPFPRCYGDA